MVISQPFTLAFSSSSPEQVVVSRGWLQRGFQCPPGLFFFFFCTPSYKSPKSPPPTCCSQALLGWAILNSPFHMSGRDEWKLFHMVQVNVKILDSHPECVSSWDHRKGRHSEPLILPVSPVARLCESRVSCCTWRFSVLGLCCVVGEMTRSSEELQGSLGKVQRKAFCSLACVRAGAVICNPPPASQEPPTESRGGLVAPRTEC